MELHSQKRAHNPPRGPQTEAYHWSMSRDVTGTGPFYRQVPGDAIKKSLSGSANQIKVCGRYSASPSTFLFLLCPSSAKTPSSPLALVSHQSFT